MTEERVLPTTGILSFLRFWNPENIEQPSPSTAGPQPNPKNFLANERTFLHWLQFCTLLGAAGVGLVNYGDKYGQYAGFFVMIITILIMFYSLYKFHSRASRIANKERGLYDDRLGAVIAVSVIVMALAFNFVLRITHPDHIHS